MDAEAQVSTPSAGSMASNLKSPPVRKESVSEIAEQQSIGRLMPPNAVRCVVEAPFRVINPNTKKVVNEATGWAMDVSSRGPLNQAGSFVGAAIIRLATADANTNSTGRVYGLNPGSFLTMASVVTGIFCAFTMPLVGVIVDHTRFRKHVGFLTAFVVSVIAGVQCMIGPNTWFSVLVLEIVGGITFIAHMSAHLSYLPDLSEYEDELVHYASRFNITQYCFQALYVAFITGLSRAISADSVITARIASGTACGLSTLYLCYAWIFLFRKRPPLAKVPDGDNLVNTGFRRIAKTARLIFTQYHSLKWFLIALLWSPEAGAGVVLAIAVTFLTVQIGFTGTQIGIINLILLAGTIPGSVFSKFVMTRINPLRSFQLALFYMACVVGLTAGILKGPDRSNWAFLISFFWGIAYGWIYPSQRVMQCTMIPKGQNNEIMGFFSFSAQILGWLPALLFSIMNEKGVDMRWGMGIISLFLLLSIFFTILIGRYEDAVAQVAAVSEARDLAETTLDRFYDEKDSIGIPITSCRGGIKVTEKGSCNDEFKIVPAESAMNECA